MERDNILILKIELYPLEVLNGFRKISPSFMDQMGKNQRKTHFEFFDDYFFQYFKSEGSLRAQNDHLKRFNNFVRSGEPYRKFRNKFDEVNVLSGIYQDKKVKIVFTPANEKARKVFKDSEIHQTYKREFERIHSDIEVELALPKKIVIKLKSKTAVDVYLSQFAFRYLNK